MDFAPTTSSPRGVQGQIRASFEGCSTITVAFFLSLHAAPLSRRDHHGCGAETRTRDHPPPRSTTRVVYIGVKQVSAPSRSSSAASPGSSSPGPQRGASGCQSGKRTSLQHVLPQQRRSRGASASSEPPSRPPPPRLLCSIRGRLPATRATLSQDCRPSWGLVRQRPTVRSLFLVERPTSSVPQGVSATPVPGRVGRFYLDR